MQVERNDFLAAMRGVAASVTVVTALDTPSGSCATYEKLSCPLKSGDGV